MNRIIPVLAAVFSAVVLAPAGHADEVLNDLKACRGLGDAERLVCFDKVLARHDQAAPVASATTPSVAPAATPPVAPANPPVASATTPPAASAATPAVAARQTEAQFGTERMTEKARVAAGEPEQLESIHAVISDYALSPTGRVILTLANGQVWRQIQGDTARFKGKAGDTIVIERGLFGSYDLTIERRNQLLKVERLR